MVSMVHEVEAVFENGLLRPLQPVLLDESDRVHLIITGPAIAPKLNLRQAEQEWLRSHAHDYPGQWLALNGPVLVSHGSDAQTVRAEARTKGVSRPLLVRVPAGPELPSAGWI